MKRDYHLHTDFSDGKNTASEMTWAAIRLGLGCICFCDHCRRDSDWLEQYVSEINRLTAEYSGRLEIQCAVETKILDFSGRLDIPEGLDGSVLRVAAIHRIADGRGGFIRSADISSPGERATALDCWKSSVEGLCQNPEISRLAHPFSLLPALGVTGGDERFWLWLDGVFSRSEYLLERNVKYDDSFLPEWFRKKYAPRMLPASDSHSVAQLEERFARL